MRQRAREPQVQKVPARMSAAATDAGSRAQRLRRISP